MKQAPKAAVALRVVNIHKAFGGKKIHQGVSFDLHEGETLALLGGSGTGKSVLLRSLVGLEQPDQGQILFDGQDLTRMNERQLGPIRTQIGYVFQNGALFDSLSVEENLSYPLQEHTDLSKGEIRERVNRILALVDLPGSNDLYPIELSGGMQKRAGMARAIILEPKIVLFDEPTAGLDPINTQRLVTNLRTLKQRGMTAVFVSHDMPSVFEISDRIAILRDGKIYAIADKHAIEKSEDPIIKSFVTGHSP